MRNPRTPEPARRNFFSDGEEGMISLVSLFAVLGLLILFGLFANAGRTTARKLETQNAADASAHAAALEMARTLNSITAANHLMGELTALCVLHHGFGGDELDENDNPNTKKSGRFDGMLGREGSDLNTLLEPLFNITKGLSTTAEEIFQPDEDAFKEIKKDPITGGALGDSHTRLKQVMVWALTIHAVGALLWFIGDILAKTNIPIVAQIGELIKVVARLIMGAARIFETKCLQEILTLKGMKAVAGGFGLRSLVKLPLMGVGGVGMISGIGNPTASYSTAAFAVTPNQMQSAAEGVAKSNLTSVVLYPSTTFKQAANLAEAIAAGAGSDLDVPVLGMPVHRDQSKPPAEITNPETVKPDTIPNPQPLAKNSYAFDGEAYTKELNRPESKQLAEWRRSQLVRATTPWVQYWRKPFLKFGEDFLLLSRFKAHYWDRTDEYTLKLTARLYHGKSKPNESNNDLFGVKPLVLKGWGPGLPNKGEEAWTKAEGSRRADELFCTVAVVSRPALPLTSAAIFRRTNPDGLAAYAQAMVYNANPQAPGGSSEFQPEVGWDTLNWATRVREFPGVRPNEDYEIVDVDEPKIKLNWNVKLVPVSRLNEPLFTGELAVNALLNKSVVGESYPKPVTQLFPFFAADSSLTKTH